nr:prolipoprotein diacylglyceryl transferase [uncultured Holophaga sp.]
MFPIHLNLGFGTFHYYEGFYFAASILVAFWLIVRRMERAGLDPQIFVGCFPWLLVGAIVGARIFHFVFWDFGSLLRNPLDFLRFWEGGLSITGGLAGGGLSALVYYRRHHSDFWRSFAVASPAILVGQAIGRVGCFLNGDAWGIPTHLPWGVSLPKFGLLIPAMRRDLTEPSAAWLWSVAQGYTNPNALRTVPLHPTQLYEALGDLLLAGIVLLTLRALARQKTPWSRVFWIHFGGYALLRFALEFLHGDRDATVWVGMTALQIGLLAFGLLSLLVLLRRTGPRAT